MFICTHKWSQRHQALRVRFQEELFRSVSHKSCSLNLPLRVGSHWASLSSSYTSEGASSLSNGKGVDTSACSGSAGETMVDLSMEASQSRVSVREGHSVKPALGNIATNRISFEHMWIQLVFFPCNFRFSAFTRLSTSTPNTKSHSQSKPCNFSALPAFLGNIMTSPLNFHAQWSLFFILSQRTLAVVEPSGPGQIHRFYHRCGDMIQLQQQIYTGILGEKCSTGKSILSWYRHLWPSSLSFTKARRSFLWGSEIHLWSRSASVAGRSFPNILPHFWGHSPDLSCSSIPKQEIPLGFHTDHLSLVLK